MKATVGEDKTSVTVSDLSKNSGSVTLTLTFKGDVTKNVTDKSVIFECKIAVFDRLRLIRLYYDPGSMIWRMTG